MHNNRADSIYNMPLSERAKCIVLLSWCIMDVSSINYITHNFRRISPLWKQRSFMCFQFIREKNNTKWTAQINHGCDPLTGRWKSHMNELQVFPEGALEEITYIDGLMQDCWNSIANGLQSCFKLSICSIELAGTMPAVFQIPFKLDSFMT